MFQTKLHGLTGNK